MGSSLQNQLGEQVRRLREARGISQEGFAALANIDRAAYGKLERGEANLTLLTLARVAAALEVDLALLFDGIKIDVNEIRSVPRKRGRQMSNSSEE
jgi:transcriptional regulator with XRE-family HTH domain